MKGYRTDTRALVLSVLIEGPSHGYAISRRIRELSQSALKMGEGQLYPALHGLEESGFIVGEWQIQEGDPPRKVYVITPSGRTELERRRAAWSSYTSAVGAVLLAEQAAGS